MIIKNSYIRIAGYGVLIISIIAFFLTWLKLYIGIPASIVLIIGYYYIIKNILNDESELKISRKVLLLIIILMFIWTLFSGIGGFFPQKYDLNWRNAVLHDLINYSWPVYYNDGYYSSLCYYFAFWIIPALLGKIGLSFGDQIGWMIANAAYGIYCFCILTLVLLLIVSYFKKSSLKSILFISSVFIFFSGIDLLPILMRQIGNTHIILGPHLEFWTSLEYSSNTTQLSWVFNQAVPAWLVTILLIQEHNAENYIYLILLLFPFGPLPFIGISIILLSQLAVELVKSLRKNELMRYIKRIISIPNLTAVITIFPIYSLYYLQNSATSKNGFTFNFDNLTLATYWIFVLVEFLYYVILVIGSSYNKRFFIAAILSLLMIPLFKIGTDQDFCMRASIPALFILMIYIINYLFENINTNEKMMSLNIGAFLLIVLLAIGAATPLTEFRESLTQAMKSGNTEQYSLADKYKTIGNTDVPLRENFIGKNSTDTIFYRYLSRK